MPMHLLTYESVSDMLARIEASCDADGSWRLLDGYQASLTSFRELPALSETVMLARTLQGLESEIAAIEALAQTLTQHLPAPASVRRVPTWGRSGSRVSVNRVLAGNLGQAWRRTERQARPQHGRVLALVVSASWSAGISAEQIRWSTAASLAWALLAEQAGYRVDVWAGVASDALWGSGGGTTMVQLKASAQPWNSQSVALSAHACFLRRLLFRLWETYKEAYGSIVSGYGHVYGRVQTIEALADWARATGRNPEALTLGALQDDRITDQASAERWLTTTLEGLAA